MSEAPPLPPPAPREAIHSRQVVCAGYRRADGLFDVEGRLIDTKSYGFANAHRGEIPPGEPIHDMALRLTVDERLRVVAVAAAMGAAPYGVCPAIAPAFDKLVGLTIGPGWRGAVRQRLGGVQGCTHLVELLGPLATTAFQTVYPLKARETSAEDERRPPPHLNTCHALAQTGEVVRRHHPRWYRPDPA